MGFFEEIRKLNVDGYAKGGKTSSRGSSSKSDKDRSGTKSSSGKASTARDSGGGNVVSNFFSNLFGGGGDDAGTAVSGSRTSSPVPTPRPESVSIRTSSGPRDVSFTDYVDIVKNPSGQRASAIGYRSPTPLPYASPEVESAINMYRLRDQAIDAGDPGFSYIDPATGETVNQRFDPITRATNMGILGAISGFTRNTILDQLNTPVSEYEGTGNAIGRFITRPRGVDRYVPVTNERGMLIGSMSVDANGRPIGYTGTQTTNATFNDPNIDQAAAAAMINPFGPSNEDSPAPAPQSPAIDPCPEGYTYDLETQSCKPDTVVAEEEDPFDQPFTTAPAAPMLTPAPNYTQVAPIQQPTLTPGTVPSLSFAPTPVQPITIGAQQGLGSFRPGGV